MTEYNALLDKHSMLYKYRTDSGGEAGDVLLIDNLAVAHRAEPSAHDPSADLRILHRTTVAGRAPLDPPPSAGLPPFLYIWGQNPLQVRYVSRFPSRVPRSFILLILGRVFVAAELADGRRRAVSHFSIV